MLARVASLDQLAPDPRGKYFVSRTWLSFFAAHGRFSGTVVWGSPTPDDVHAWESAADLRLSGACAPHATLFDAHRVERLSPSAYGVLARYAVRKSEALTERITRLAIVHWGGFAGAVALGFSKLVPLSFPIELFGDAAAALGWLGCSEDAALLDQIGRAHAEARSIPPLVRDLGAYLHHHPSASPGEAARALALSTRTLQRKLADHATSFRRERDQARLRRAQSMLLDSDAPVTTVALEVGLTSTQHLSDLFRKFGFDSPQKWRAKARADQKVY